MRIKADEAFAFESAQASRVGMRLTFSRFAKAHWLSFSFGLNVPSRIAVRIFSVTNCCTVLYENREIKVRTSFGMPLTY